MQPRQLALGLALLSMGCDRADLFRVAGYQQESLSNKADILFVVDNSDSMQSEAEALAISFEPFLRGLSADVTTFGTDGVTDAVDNYITLTTSGESVINFQIGVTTTDVSRENGLLVGNRNIVRRTDADPGQAVIENLLCEATCFNDGVASSPNYQCGDPLGGTVSTQYLQCQCGNLPGDANCGGAVEEHLEAVFMAMCRSVPNPPVSCFDEELNDGFTNAEVMTNGGFLRENSTLIPVLVTDEGDSSRRVTAGEPEPREYVDLYAQFGQRMTWAVIGPALDPDTGKFPCPSGASVWGATRFQYLVSSTAGLSVPILSPENNCETRSFDSALEQLGDLLKNLLTSFPLQSVPVLDTLSVRLDGEDVPEAEITGYDALGLPLWSDGWSYRVEDNTVQFHGDAVPQVSSNVRVYYLPQDGNPRPLPF